MAVSGQYPEVDSGALPVADVGRLLLRCGDRPGLVAAVSAFLADAGANIVSLDQHSTEQSGGTFFQRTIFHLPGLTAARDALERDFGDRVAAPFEMDFRLTEAAKPKRVAIMASKDDHCLLDLLWRNRRGELDMSVVMVISNHPDLADQVRPFGVPFLHVPATKDIRAQAEQRQLDLLRHNVDLVVLARYMQIITPQFLADVGCPLINIHHSFLPSFIGASPYRGPRSAESNSSVPPPTTSPMNSTTGRSSNRTSCGWTTVTASVTWSASAPTSSGPCCHARSCGIARTASSDTATTPSSSDGAAKLDVADLGRRRTDGHDARTRVPELRAI